MHQLNYTGTLDQRAFDQLVSSHPWWYHSYYFDNGFSVRGDYNIGADIQDYGFPPSLRGLKVLDVGVGGGWFSLYLEQQGAEVTAIDARGYSDFDVFGRYQYPPITAEGRSPDRYAEDGAPIYDSPVSKTFWIMRDLLGSKVRFKNARIYDLSPQLFEGQSFDLVFIGALLLHLRDPIGALMAARSVCHGQIMASTPIVVNDPDSKFPFQQLPWTHIDRISWWLPNRACFKLWFEAAGFRNVDVSRIITLRSDLPHLVEERQVNENQQLCVGQAFV
jgi:tRNA (mo5U34)-methyltransferase